MYKHICNKRILQIRGFQILGMHGVITADIIDSKTYPDLAVSLKPKLAMVRADSLLTPFSLSRGDEVQAVCGEVSALPVLLRALRFNCRPCRLRIGVGIGAVDDREMAANSWEMSGEAFFRARQALERLGKVKKPETWLIGEDPRFDTALNTIYQLLDLIMADWTDEQWQAVMAYEENETQLKAAEKLHVSRQNVQKLCRAAKWDHIRLAETNLAALLKYHFGGNR